MAKSLKHTVTALWHWLVALMCLAGMLIGAKLGIGIYKIATTETNADQPWLWWLGLSVIVAVSGLLIWEGVRRVRLARGLKKATRDL